MLTSGVSGPASYFPEGRQGGVPILGLRAKYGAEVRYAKLGRIVFLFVGRRDLSGRIATVEVARIQTPIVSEARPRRVAGPRRAAPE